MSITNRITDKQKEDIGTNGLLKRKLALNIFNNINTILWLVFFNAIVLVLSGDKGIHLNYQGFNFDIPAINPQAAIAVTSIVSFVLGALINERTQILGFYFGNSLPLNADLDGNHIEHKPNIDKIED